MAGFGEWLVNAFDSLFGYQSRIHSFIHSLSSFGFDNGKVTPFHAPGSAGAIAGTSM